MRKLALLTLAGALALSACGKKHDDDATINNLVEPPVENVIIDEPDAIQPALPEVTNNVSAAVAPPPRISDDQQMLDDAEASGMTSRIAPRGEESHGSDESTAGM